MCGFAYKRWKNSSLFLKRLEARPFFKKKNTQTTTCIGWQNLNRNVIIVHQYPWSSLHQPFPHTHTEAGFHSNLQATNTCISNTKGLLCVGHLSLRDHYKGWALSLRLTSLHLNPTTFAWNHSSCLFFFVITYSGIYRLILSFMSGKVRVFQQPGRRKCTWGASMRVLTLGSR